MARFQRDGDLFEFADIDRAHADKGAHNAFEFQRSLSSADIDLGLIRFHFKAVHFFDDDGGVDFFAALVKRFVFYRCISPPRLP